MSERRSAVRACSRAPACRWPVKSSRSASGTIPRAVASAIATPAQSVSRRRAAAMASAVSRSAMPARTSTPMAATTSKNRSSSAARQARQLVEEDGRREPRGGFLRHPASGAPGEGESSERDERDPDRETGPGGAIAEQGVAREPEEGRLPEQGGDGRRIGPDAGAGRGDRVRRALAVAGREAGFDGGRHEKHFTMQSQVAQAPVGGLARRRGRSGSPSGRSTPMVQGGATGSDIAGPTLQGSGAQTILRVHHSRSRPVCVVRWTRRPPASVGPA